ncbi:MAG: D-2-hydroxyacid dehydrogenase [Bacteroidetes bacterium]|nr:D-2-hydroxyacid dehydrogenase [Bacteroidota bacterium]
MQNIPQIAVLDGFAMNPGDLSWDALRALGTVELHDRTPAGEIVRRAQHAEIIITNKVPFTRETIAQLPRLRYLGVTATGYNIIDVAAAKERNITVTNVPAYSTDSVAQLVFALVLEFTHRAGHHADAVRSGRWSTNPDFAFWDFPLTELAGKTFGIVGYGNIGRAVARIAAAFGMQVLVATRSTPADPSVVNVDLAELLRRSDIISLHCPLTAQTDKLINASTLALMKPAALLINTGRGGLVDEQALADALNSGRLAGAGLDVLSTEPPSPQNPLITAKNTIITPHIAWASFAARTRLMDVVVNNVRAFLSGHPVNVVS